MMKIDRRRERTRAGLCKHAGSVRKMCYAKEHAERVPEVGCAREEEVTKGTYREFSLVKFLERGPSFLNRRHGCLC